MKKMRSFAIAGLIALGVGHIAPAAAQDAAAGEQVFMKCRICHQIGPGAQSSIGPELNGVVGRKSGSAPGYDYSDANKKSGLTWDVPTLTRYLKDPQGVVPGTKMTFAGLSSENDVTSVIAYLQQFGPDGEKK